MFYQDSDGESSPWDSPLSSARDPVKRKEQIRNKIPRTSAGSAVDSEDENSTAKKNIPPEDASSTKENGSFINVEVNNRKISPRQEQQSHPNSKKPNLKIKHHQKVPSFHDFKEPETRSWGVPAREREPTSGSNQKLNSSAALYETVSAPDITQTLTERAAQVRGAQEIHMSNTDMSGHGQCARNTSDLLKNEKRDFSGVPGVGERMWNVEHGTKQHDVKGPPMYLNYGWNMEPVYTDPENAQLKVSLVTETVPYKDELHMYQFDYGHRQYYQAHKDPNEAFMEKLADKSEKLILRCWREIFGFLRILAGLVTIFLIELITFLGKYIFQVLFVGFLTALGDHVVKPVLVALFNHFLQPLLIFIFNILYSLHNLWFPILDVLRGIAQQIATVLQAFRLVEVHTGAKCVTPHVQNV
ncbi:uncharacterized protein LOC100490973 isoform X3 [Xenopus tropicalis]|uniref:Uncharacterized protein LOC100490973 isoform X3 n=1 Tax=Xenopus tropicalis TaxID=8364 RepID=A0A8J1JAR0_XENTR|nr:uncharacterized protein LOC100490973 isoform X3 [Xenopus tropicalis]